MVFLDREVQCLAFCCLHQGFRRFTVLQMKKVRMTDENFRLRRVPLLRAFLDQLRNSRRQGAMLDCTHA